MFATKAIILCAAIISICHARTQAEPLTVSSLSKGSIGGNTDELTTIYTANQLSKYRKFLLQAIISFEDVCDAYNAHPAPAAAGEAPNLFRYYQPPEQRSEIWAFFKLLMAQFNDLEFMNVIRNAVIERCRIKSQLQRDEKRNSVVLGKKQRFHSWGGKRAPALGGGSLPADTEDHSAYYY